MNPTTETLDVLIIGGGLSGLATAHFLKKNRPDLSIAILEGSDRCGGAIRTMRENGFIAEWGPHGFLDNNQASRELLADLGLDRVALKAPLTSYRRYICRSGRLISLPQSPGGLLTTRLLSFPAKLRLMLDLFKPYLAGEPTISEWARYRFGPAVLPLVDAAVTGTYAGDPARLSMDAVMPGARRLERAHNSLFKGLAREQKKNKKDKERGRRLPAMTTFPEGMETLPRALAARHPVRLGSPAESVRKQGGGWEVASRSRDQVLSCRKLVVALPVNQALDLLAPLGAPSRRVPEARILTVALGFASQQARLPLGFGYLAPEAEGRFSLGAMFTSQMFDGRAPSGTLLVEALVGGRRHPERLELPDTTIVEQVLDDLGELLQLPEPPVFTRVLRPRGGIPQPESGFLSLLRWRENLLQHHPDLAVIGFGWDGIGMNDMMRAAKEAALRLLGEGNTAQGAQVKPVYF